MWGSPGWSPSTALESVASRTAPERTGEVVKPHHPRLRPASRCASPPSSTTSPATTACGHPLLPTATGSRRRRYGVVERGLWAEGGPNEWGVPTFPSRRFVAAGGLTVTHRGLCEYELVDLDGDAEAPGTTAGALALTLVRATGWLSRGPMASRPLPAGPELPLEGSQVRGLLRLEYAVVDEAVDATSY